MDRKKNNPPKKHFVFSLEYVTLAGYTLRLLADWMKNGVVVDHDVAYLTSPDKRQWTGDLELAAGIADEIRYRFEVVNNEGRIADCEMRGMYHHFRWTSKKDVRLFCLWNTQSDRCVLYSSAFAWSKANNSNTFSEKENCDDNLILQFPDYLLPKDYELAITGNQQVMGNWTPSKALPLKRGTNHSWELRVNTQEMDFPLEYKCVLRKDKSHEVVWESGMNRILQCVSENVTTVCELSMPRLPEASPRVAGIVIPVFSLRSSQSCGVGDFGDLRQFVAWAASVGLRMVQVLPVNDTTRSGDWSDSYPYNAISVFALHPMYINLGELKPLKNTKLVQRLEEERKKLNSLDSVDYEGVNRLKNEFLRAYYQQEGETVVHSDAFQQFVRKQHYWIWAYCFFRYFQQHFATSDFRQWGDFKRYHEASIRTWMDKEGCWNEVYYYAFVQFLLHSQLSKVHEEACRLGVALKGDIPIGVSRDSASAWQNPSYFNFDGQAGAPPDYFSKDGQNWGFPTYRWDKIMKDGWRWWKERLRVMADYFDAYRIDHVLGFFRIWEIPVPYASGMVGHFNPAMPLSKEEIRRAGFKADIEHSHRGKWLEEELKNELFFPDRQMSGFYHLNIGAKGTERYKSLDNANRQAYDRLFNDFFFHRHDDFWANAALKKLQNLVDATNMLPCAEDLGMIPDCMRRVLNQLYILSLEVERMPKYSWGRFADVLTNPFLSVDTISTHDMEPLRLWWRDYKEDAQEYFNRVLHHLGVCNSDMTGSLCEEVLLRHLQSPSLLCVLAWQDWSSIDEKIRSNDLDSEQINKPAVSRHYWRYRMGITIEELNKNADFNLKIKKLITSGGRF